MRIVTQSAREFICVLLYVRVPERSRRSSARPDTALPPPPTITRVAAAGREAVGVLSALGDASPEVWDLFSRKKPTSRASDGAAPSGAAGNVTKFG